MEIPEDVMKAARRTYDALGRGSISDSEHIARAILEAEKRGEERERERCARIADESGDRADRFVRERLTGPSIDFQRYAEGCRAVAAAIRRPTILSEKGEGE